MIVNAVTHVYVYKQCFLEVANSKKGFFSCGMVLEWREREHEEVYVVVERDPGGQMALKICGLYNFLALKGMRDRVRLLQLLVAYWDPDSESFNLDGKP